MRSPLGCSHGSELRAVTARSVNVLNVTALRAHSERTSGYVSDTPIELFKNQTETGAKEL